MRRKLFNVAVVMSLVLCLATSVLWARSLRLSDVVALVNPTTLLGEKRTRWYVSAAAGEARVMRVRGPIRFSHSPDRLWWSESLDGRDGGPWSFFVTYSFCPDSEWRLLGMSLHKGGMGSPISYWALAVPLWMPGLSFALLPSLWSLRWWRRPRTVNVCRDCGYDLRDTPDRCPECGAVPNYRSTAAA